MQFMTGASCKSFYRRFIASDTLHTSISEVEKEILAKPIEQEIDRYCQTDLSFPVMRFFFMLYIVCVANSIKLGCSVGLIITCIKT